MAIPITKTMITEKGKHLDEGDEIGQDVLSFRDTWVYKYWSGFQAVSWN